MSRTSIPAGAPVLVGSTLGHMQASLKPHQSAHVIAASAYRDGGFCFMDMPVDSVTRLEGPALPANIVKARITAAVLGK